MGKNELTTYKRSVRHHLDELTDLLAKASVGDFSHQLRIPNGDNQFAEVYSGIQLLLDVIRNNYSELDRLNTVLAKDVVEARNKNSRVLTEMLIDEAILDSIGEGLIVVGTDSKVKIVNPAACQILGLPAQSFYGKKYWEIFDAVDVNGQPIPKEKRPPSLAMSYGRKVSFRTVTYKVGSSSEIPVAVTASPIRVENKIIGTVMVFRDITEEREIDRAKTEVVSFTSHQLRTPLSVINWYSEVLLGEHLGPLTTEQRKYQEVILFTARRMIELVNTFLSVSRIQLGTLVMDVRDVNIKDIVNSVLEELETEIGQKEMKISCHSVKNPILKTDPKLIRVVFQNLVNNAVKYTPKKGTVKIDIGPCMTGKQRINDCKLIVKITDTGYGIPEKSQGKIFTKLFRAENAQQIDTEGAGLGLYMVKSIVNYAGGDVWFESKINKGTTFYVELPSKPSQVKNNS